MARRLASRSLGVVFGGAGARAFAHLGVLDVLMGAGMRADRVGGVSMGAFVGALLAAGHDSASIDACCYEEWVRRNPINDYTLPRASLVKGRKAQAMLDESSARCGSRSCRARSTARASIFAGNLRIDRTACWRRQWRERLAATDRAADRARSPPADRRLAAEQLAVGADERGCTLMSRVGCFSDHLLGIQRHGNNGVQISPLLLHSSRTITASTLPTLERLVDSPSPSRLCTPECAQQSFLHGTRWA